MVIYEAESRCWPIIGIQDTVAFNNLKHIPTKYKLVDMTDEYIDMLIDLFNNWEKMKVSLILAQELYADDIYLVINS
jgi:hypothetical protein